MKKKHVLTVAGRRFNHFCARCEVDERTAVWLKGRVVMKWIEWKRKCERLSRIAICTVLVVGCHHKAKPAASPAAVTGANLNPIDAGRAILTNKCNGCHAQPTVSDHSLADWTKSIIPSMAPKAGLSATDQQNLTAYVQSVLAASK